MSALERAQRSYAQVPRTLDENLERKARGDRGCLFDLVSIFGILLMFGCLVASLAGKIAFSWTYLGAGIWVGSYFLGLRRQSSSAEQRTAALTRGPLVAAAVVRCSPHLRVAGNKRSGRAAVVFRTEASARFDIDTLHGMAEALADWPAPSPGDSSARGRAQYLLHDEYRFDLIDISGLDMGDGEAAPRRFPPQTWVGRVVVDPERLDQPLSGRAAQLALIVDPDTNFVEHV